VELQAENDITGGRAVFLVVAFHHDISFQQLSWFNNNADPARVFWPNIVDSRCVHGLHGLVELQEGSASSPSIEAWGTMQDDKMKEQR
jgi:hypothetical protein